MSYRRVVPIEFNHCDPAGIVFYPRYFEMTNSVVENFFAEVLDWPFGRIVGEGCGVPTVRLETVFRRPSRLGDRVAFDLFTRAVGGSSARFTIEACCGEEVRITAEITLVWIDATGRAAPWPDDLRRRLAATVEPVG